MDTLNKVFQMKCVFMIVTCLLGNAHSQLMGNGEVFEQYAKLIDGNLHRSVRNVGSDNATTENNPEFSATDVPTAANSINKDDGTAENYSGFSSNYPKSGAVNETRENISSTIETLVSTSNPNIGNTTSSNPLETNSKKPDDNVSESLNSPKETAVPLVLTQQNPKTDNSSFILVTSNPKFDDVNGTQFNNNSTNETPVPSNLTSNLDAANSTSLPPGSNLDSYSDGDVTKTINSASESNPNIENTTFPPESNSSKPKDDVIESKINSSSPIETLFISTPTPIVETTTPSVIPVTKPSHIMKIPEKPRISLLDPTLVSSADEELVGVSNTNPIIASDVLVNPPENQTSVTENPANSKGDEIKSNETCSSVRTSLMDSISNTFIDVLEQLVGFFVNALDATFDQIFEPLMPPLLEKIASFLDIVRTDVEKDVEVLANSALATVLEKKLATSSKFDTLNHFINDSQKAASVEVNATILAVFEKIELWLNEFGRAELLDSTLLDARLRNISALLNHTVNGFLHSVREVTAGQVVESPLAKNSSEDMTQLVDNFLNDRAARFGKLFNGSESFTELVGDLMEITGKYRNIFVKDIDSLLVDSLVRVNYEKGLFDELLENISFVLQHLRRNLLDVKIDRAKNSVIFADLGQFEESSLSKIKSATIPLYDEYILYQNLNLPEFIDSILNPARDAINARKQVFDSLKNMSESTNKASVSAAFTLIKNSLYETIFNLQKEVPPLLENHFFNSSRSLNMSTLSSTYDRTLRNYSEKLYECENGRGGHHNERNTTDASNSETKFSTSRGIFTYPFEYLLMFTVLINYFAT